MKLTLFLLLALSSLIAVSASHDDCPYGWHIQIHNEYVGKDHYVLNEQMNADYVRFRMVAEMGAFRHEFISNQLWALKYLQPVEEDPIVLKSTCKTESELIYGFWETSAMYCYVILPWLQNVRRAKCDRSESCCGKNSVCHEDGYARQRYWVYCAHYTSPFNGYFAVRYDSFPQCCTCRKCDKCIDSH
ncbi:uncharacterized protein LOC117329162 [Pecten maximus]|uniref:uncharacterized protein LOC117329162 n=1 Tax=Pecten maximus TaxID=6579 RepID=UPI0014591004|nr:uncharacterized protein LOC117329162 [Pecten maximus]